MEAFSYIITFLFGGFEVLQYSHIFMSGRVFCLFYASLLALQNILFKKMLNPQIPSADFATVKF